MTPVLVLFAGTIVITTACRRGPADAAPSGARSATPAHRLGPCPPPLSFASGERRPLGVRIENRTSERVLVYLDRCRGHSRVGSVAAGRSRLYRLPTPLVETWGGLTFHAFAVDRYEYLGPTTLPVDTTTVLTLAVEPVADGEECEPSLYVNGEPFAGTLADLPAGSVTGILVRESRDPDVCRELHVRMREGGG